MEFTVGDILKKLKENVKPCENITYKCSLPRLHGYRFCENHILSQRGQNEYVRCSYRYPHNERCTKTVHVGEKKGEDCKVYCYNHIRKQQLKRAERQKPKMNFVDTADSLLGDLSKHLSLKNFENDLETEFNEYSPGESEFDIDVEESEDDTACGFTDPFKPYEALKPIEKIMAKNKKLPKVYFDAYSEKQRKLPNRYEKTMTTPHDMLESDDSVESGDDELLKHAEVFSREEVVRITKEKCLKLREYYEQKIWQLKQEYAKNYEAYENAVKQEEKNLGSVYKRLKEVPKERFMYRRLKSLAAFGHRNRHEWEMARKLQDKIKSKNNPHFSEAYDYEPCLFINSDGVLCKAFAIPLIKYCRQHVLSNEHQLLYRACGAEILADVICKEPVLNLDDHSRCIWHREFHISSPKKCAEESPKKSPEETEESDEEIPKEGNESGEETPKDIPESPEESEESAEETSKGTKQF